MWEGGSRADYSTLLEKGNILPYLHAGIKIVSRGPKRSFSFGKAGRLAILWCCLFYFWIKSGFLVILNVLQSPGISNIVTLQIYRCDLCGSALLTHQVWGDGCFFVPFNLPGSKLEGIKAALVDLLVRTTFNRSIMA